MILQFITTLAYITTVITTSFKQYGSYRTVEPFDLPTQNTISIHISNVFKPGWHVWFLEITFVYCVCMLLGY